LLRPPAAARPGAASRACRTISRPAGHDSTAAPGESLAAVPWDAVPSFPPETGLDRAGATMPQPTTTTPARLLSYEAAPAYSSLSPATLKRMPRDGRLRRVAAPGVARVLVDREQLDEVLLRGAAATSAAPKVEADVSAEATQPNEAAATA